MILLPVLCTNGFLIFLPELFGMTGWILLFFILFVLSLLFLHAVTQIPVILKPVSYTHLEPIAARKPPSPHTI